MAGISGRVAYVTYGGFDWMTATVGGLWDALLSEGRLLSVTANSDNHRTVGDTWRNGDWLPGQNFDNIGRLPDPVDTGVAQPGSDLWPGQYGPGLLGAGIDPHGPVAHAPATATRGLTPGFTPIPSSSRSATDAAAGAGDMEASGPAPATSRMTR